MELKKYEAVCCNCGCSFLAHKSIAQRDFGMLRAGTGTCPNCKTFLNLTFDEKLEKMITKHWDIYVAEERENDKRREKRSREDI